MPFGDADALGGDGGSSLVEELHLLHERGVFRADQVFLGDANVVEDEFGGVGCTNAEFAGDLLGGEAVAVRLDDDLAEAVVPALGVGIGLTEDDEEVTDGAVGDPHLVPVYYPLVAVFSARVETDETSDPVSGSEIAAPEIFAQRDRL